MNVPKIFAIALGCSLLALGAALANAVSKTAPAADADVTALNKVSRGEAHEPVIVSGRSVGGYHKSRMHHVRVKKNDSTDEPFAGDVAPRDY